MPIPADTSEHRGETHRRWIQHRNRDTASDDYREQWYSGQCGGCWFYVPLAGEYGYDWGVCTNSRSPFDRRAMFEHDGCEAFESAGEWVTTSDFEI